jgi:putative colanic acid biosynthesis acetyltransferase WcaF
MPLIGKPILMESDIWVAANCIVGPGVEIKEGVVLGAGTALFKGTKPWTVYAGNPAAPVGERKVDCCPSGDKHAN